MGILTVLTIAALAWASDPWKSKPYQQWDKKDVTKILTDSPWAKIARINADWEHSGMSELPSAPQPEQRESNAPGGAGARPGMGGSAQAPGGEMEPGRMQQGGTPQVAFVIRWVSARTMREALLRGEVLDGKMSEQQAQADVATSPNVYEIVVAGPQMLPFEQTTEQEVKKGTFLEMKKSKQRIEPVKVEFQRTPDGRGIRGVLISFPKTTAGGQPTLTPNEKGAQFSIALARTKIQTNFDFTKMEDAQGRDL